MTDLHDNIDALEDAFHRMREGDFQAFNQAPLLIEELRKSAAVLESRQQELTTLYEVGQEIVSILNLDRLLESILDRAIVLVGANRGFLVLCDEQQDSWEVAVARQFSWGEVDDAQIEISHNVIRRVLASREPVVTTNAQEDPRFRSSHSIVTYQIRSVLATPLQAKSSLIGAIYVDTRIATRLFGESDLALLSALANQAAVAIELARLYEDLQTRNLELQQALTDLQAAQDELIRAERLSLVGRMASSIIHDLKHPMTTIKGYAALLGMEELDPEQRRAYSRIISRSVDSFVEMTQEILDYARGGGDLQPSRVQIDTLIGDLITFLERDFEDRNLSLECQLDFAGPLMLDESKVRRALYNICCNARDAMTAGGTLTISTRATNGMVECCLADTGPGITAEI